ncbi:hypothetical protein Kpol_1048p50 [Vanderwaltozyma polyspora DSM 70294]|uniref:Alkaline ceramidase YPC1 n=1 Tax=Vanderwaltozyma polyspora (strain ATCC 22028 / DSM 70294 / BCRC 21397 / CBS 2163 / NBRC 10782 / NRRL Y-8283 / UCD 57-17) TaxID=436907 RepID=A7TGL2_VANPO|nr:uncharacterized protein Kpol_1048p50 [Vanderwaltozyma polyspora DSM 70294]EDO18619.1 hypothetical protein Kpol_1048p50 [Vanderwaltozyma polyspora DSM 70294]
MGFLRWPYPETPIDGHWGNVTATIDWCEENYVVSSYIAEWSNTISNITYLITASYATYCAYRNQMELRFILIGAGFAVVGVGSWLFHMTLLYRYQLLDELPMIYATTIPAWSMICEYLENKPNNKGNKRQLDRIEWAVGFILSVLVIGITVFYIINRNPLFHEFAYAFLTGIVVIIAGWLNYKHVRNPRAKKNLTHCMAIGIMLFGAGFLSWQLDIRLCSHWINIRRSYLKLPLGIFLELHGWWHVLTGLGVYYYIVFLQYLRVLTQGMKDVNFIWRWRVLPELVRNDHAINTNFSYEFLGNYATPEVSV